MAVVVSVRSTPSRVAPVTSRNLWISMEVAWQPGVGVQRIRPDSHGKPPHFVHLTTWRVLARLARAEVPKVGSGQVGVWGAGDPAGPMWMVRPDWNGQAPEEDSAESFPFRSAVAMGMETSCCRVHWQSRFPVGKWALATLSAYWPTLTALVKTQPVTGGSGCV